MPGADRQTWPIAPVTAPPIAPASTPDVPAQPTQSPPAAQTIATGPDSWHAVTESTLVRPLPPSVATEPGSDHAQQSTSPATQAAGGTLPNQSGPPPVPPGPSFPDARAVPAVSGSPAAGSGGASRRRTGWAVLAGVVALVVLGAAVTAVWLSGRESGGPSRTPAADTSTQPGEAGGAFAAPSDSTASSSSAGPSASASKAGPPTDPNLIGADEFTGPAPDTGKWVVYHSTAPNGGVWAVSQVRVTGGELQIVGAGRNPTGQGNLAGGLCWCGTGGNQIYGIWKVRAKFDAGAGYGPIIGLWPQSDQGARDGSITFATLPGADKRTLDQRVVWSDNGTRVSDGVDVHGDFTGWHTYTVEWRATSVKLSLDDKVVYDSTTSTKGVVIPKTPMHLIVQVQVGPADGVPAANASTPDQVLTHLDWARMYR